MAMDKKPARPAGKPGGKFRKGGPMKKKVCRFCVDKIEIDYKNVSLLRAFVTESGKKSGHSVLILVYVDSIVQLSRLSDEYMRRGPPAITKNHLF